MFALHRIGTPAARAAVRAALDDRDAGVRVAAARSVGLAKDAAALPVLLRAVVTDAPAVRRQSATALEQIGKVEAVPALLKASQDPADRFVEHAVIHALIALREPAPLVTALESASSNERRAALIALDQMGGLRAPAVGSRAGPTSSRNTCGRSWCPATTRSGAPASGRPHIIRAGPS